MSAWSDFKDGFREGAEKAPVIIGVAILAVMFVGGLVFVALLSLLTYCIRNPAEVLFITAAIGLALILSGGLHV